MNHIRMFILKCRAGWIQAQIDHAEDLIANHRANLAGCHRELRRIKAKHATITPASTLLAEALKRKG